MNDQITPNNQETNTTNGTQATSLEPKKKASPEKQKRLFLFLIVMLGAFAFLVLFSFLMGQRFESSAKERTFNDKIMALQDESINQQVSIDDLTSKLSAAEDTIAEMQTLQEERDLMFDAVSSLLLLYSHVDNNEREEATVLAEHIVQEGFADLYDDEYMIIYSQLLKQMKKW